MTGQEREHAAFDELAAAYVLHALDSDDEQRFLSHAEDCPTCPEVLAAFSDVAAALAETAPAAEPGPELGERIMAVVRADLADDTQPASPEAAPSDTQPASPETGAGDVPPAAPAPGAGAGTGTAEAPPGRVIPLARRPAPRWLRPVAAAAAAAVVIGGGIWAGLAATATNPPPAASLPASCAHQRHCAQVAVVSPKTHRQAARVVVLNSSIYLTPTGLPPDNRTDHIYVLWQIPKGHNPVAVGSFDVHAGPNGAIKVGRLVAPYHRTGAFAISLEPGRRIPPAPSKVVAVGLIT